MYGGCATTGMGRGSYGLGIEPVATATAIVAAFNVVSGLFSNPNDPSRIAQNEEAFRRYMDQGDDYSLMFLKGRTGDFGSVNIPVRLDYAFSPSSGAPETPGPIGGWATTKAKQHARALYDSALASPGVSSPVFNLPGIDVSVRSPLPYLLAGLALLAVVKPSRTRW